jgi:hypothetical protein
MYRSLLVCLALCGLAACFPPPGTPETLYTPVAGEWTGTFESSWGSLPMRASLQNTRYTQSITGTFSIDGQRATGTISGNLETKERDIPGWFLGSLTIAYAAADGSMCQSRTASTQGSATERWFSFETNGFPTGNCSDSPTAVRITLRR